MTKFHVSHCICSQMTINTLYTISIKLSSSLTTTDEALLLQTNETTTKIKAIMETQLNTKGTTVWQIHTSVPVTTTDSYYSGKTTTSK